MYEILNNQKVNKTAPAVVVLTCIVKYPLTISAELVLHGFLKPRQPNTEILCNCFTVHFNSLNVTYQLMHYYIQSYISVNVNIKTLKNAPTCFDHYSDHLQ
jgi:hypothetical protein